MHLIHGGKMTGKIRFSRHPYIGSSIKKPKKVMRKLKRGKKQLKVFLLVLAGEDGRLEIHHNIFLRQWYYINNGKQLSTDGFLFNDKGKPCCKKQAVAGRQFCG